MQLRCVLLVGVGLDEVGVWLNLDDDMARVATPEYFALVLIVGEDDALAIGGIAHGIASKAIGRDREMEIAAHGQQGIFDIARADHLSLKCLEEGSLVADLHDPTFFLTDAIRMEIVLPHPPSQEQDHGGDDEHERHLHRVASAQRMFLLVFRF